MIARVISAGALVAACLVFLAPSPPAQACSCVPRTTQHQAKFADAVFAGSVSEEPTPYGTGELLYRVTVDQVWKGEVHEVVTVATGDQSSACGIEDLPEDRSILWFTFVSVRDVDGDALFTTNSCSGTGPSSSHHERILTQQLGAADAPIEGNEVGAEAEDNYLLVGLAIGGFLLLGGFGVYDLMRRRRTRTH